MCRVGTNPMTKPTRCRESNPLACVVCRQHLGTRQAMLDGRLSWICDHCPTPQEIATACRHIQEGWSKNEEWARSRRPVRTWELEELRDDRRRVRKGTRGT